MRMPQMIDHDRHRQPPQNVGEFNDLIGLNIELDVPAECRHTLRQRLDHVGLHRARFRVAETEADAAYAGLVKALEFSIADGRMHHRNTTRIFAELL